MDNVRRSVCVAVLVAVATMLAVACGGSSGSATPSVSPVVTAAASVTGKVSVTATASPAATAAPIATQHPIEPCPDQSACDFGHSLAAALKSGDASFILSRWSAEPTTCPGDVPQLGGPFPLCDGAVAGEVRFGYPFRGSTEGSELSAAQVGTLFGTPPYAGSPWALRTVGCPPPIGTAPCSDSAIIVLSTQSVGPDLLFDVSQTDGQWAFTLQTQGPLFQPDLDSILVNGGFVGTSTHGSVPDDTRFYRVN